MRRRVTRQPNRRSRAAWLAILLLYVPFASASAQSLYDAGELAAARNHPDCKAVIASLTSSLDWPAEKLRESPERMVWAVDVYAQRFALTGEDYQGAKVKPILREIRDRWPLPFANLDHELTLNHIPRLCRAAKLWPQARADLEFPLRWCEARMTEPQRPGTIATAIMATNEIVGLRALAAIRDVLYGPESARATALEGFGPYSVQWGLRRILDEGFDAQGNARFHEGREGHHAWTSRPAMVWLLDRLRVAKHLTPDQRRKAKAYHQRPCRLLCVGGKSFTFPGLNDEYGVNPILGPYAAWTHASSIDKWARATCRMQSPPVFDDLFMPVDVGYTRPERPPGCKGSRTFGKITITETAAESIVTYTPTGIGEISGRAERVKVKAEVKVKKLNVTQAAPLP